MLHNFKQFSNHLIASQLQQRLAASSRPRSRPTDAWCRCARRRLFTQSPLKRAAWKCRQQLTFLAPDWSQRTWNGSTVFLLLSNQKQTAFFPSELQRRLTKPPELAALYRRVKSRGGGGEIATCLLAALNEAAVERGVPIRPLQQRQRLFGVELPPHEQVVRVQLVHVGRRRVTFHLTPLSVVGQVPRLHLAQEVHHLGVTAVPGNTRCSWRHASPKRNGRQPPSVFRWDAVTAQQRPDIPKMVSLNVRRDNWNVLASWNVRTRVGHFQKCK